MQGYKFILFDADETLFDFKACEREALRSALELSGICASDAMLTTYNSINDSFWKALERGEIDRKTLSLRRFEVFCECFELLVDPCILAENYLLRLSQTTFLIDGAEELLSALYGKVKMYIITNGIERVQKGRFALSSISRLFDGIFISEALGANKPEIAFFERVAESIDGFSKKDALVVGDSLSSDILGGNRFGIDTCLFLQNGDVSSEILPTYTVKRLSDVLPIALGGE